MHQWWGDNVAASLTRYTFLKEGMATLRVVAGDGADGGEQCRRLRSPAGDAAFDQSLVDQFDSAYNRSGSSGP